MKKDFGDAGSGHYGVFSEKSRHLSQRHARAVWYSGDGEDAALAWLIYSAMAIVVLIMVTLFLANARQSIGLLCI